MNIQVRVKSSKKTKITVPRLGPDDVTFKDGFLITGEYEGYEATFISETDLAVGKVVTVSDED